MAKVFHPAAQAEVELPPAEAQDAIARGEVAVTGKQLVKKGETIMEIDASRLGEAFDMGWQLSDNEDAAQVTLRREESDASSIALGTAEAGLRGITLGLSDVVATKLGADAERMRARQEAGGNAFEGVELAAALLGGGAGLAKKGAQTAGGRLLALSPAALATRAGARTTSMVGGAAPSGVRAALATGAGQAVEGYFFGAGNELTEASLGERDINAEKMLLEDGLMGAAIDGALGIGGYGVGRIAQGLDKLPERATRRLLNDLPSAIDTDKVIDSAAKTSAFLTGGDPEVFLKAGGYLKTPQGRKIAHEAINDFDGTLERTSREIVSNVEVANARLAEAVDLATGASKLNRVAELLPKHADVVAAGASRKLIRELDDNLARIEAKGMTRGGYVLNDIESARERLGTALAEMLENPGGVRTFRALNRLKQDLDIVTRSRRGMITHEVQDTITEIRQVAGRVREHLEDTRLWGDAGNLQKQTNAAYSQMMRSSEDLGSRGSVLGRMLDPTTPVSPADALMLAKQYGKIQGEAKFAKIDAALDDRLAYIDTVRQHYELPPEVAAKFDEAHDAVLAMRRALADKAEVAEALQVFNKIRNAQGAGSPSLNVLSGVGGLFGMSVGGPLGLLVGHVATSPYTTLRSLIGIAHFADRAGVKIDGAIGKVLGRVRSGVSAAGRKTASGARAAVGPISMTAVGADNKEERRAQTLRTIERVNHIIRDPNRIPDETEYPFFDAREAAPRLVATMTDRIYGASAFLASKAPAVYKAPFSNAPVQYDETQMAAFERYEDAVRHPLKMFDKLADGTLTAEHAEALRVCWPKLYSRAQETITQELAEAEYEQRPIDFDTRISLGTMFQIATDVSLLPNVFHAIQQVHVATTVMQQAQQAVQTSSKNVKLEEATTATQQMQREPGHMT